MGLSAASDMTNRRARSEVAASRQSLPLAFLAVLVLASSAASARDIASTYESFDDKAFPNFGGGNDDDGTTVYASPPPAAYQEPVWPTPSCPDGYAYYPDGEICKKISKADPEPYCEDDDYVLVLLSDYTKICEYTDYKAVTYNCPATYELKTYGDEYKCEKLVYEDFWLSCPYEGYDLVKDEYGSKCEHVATAEAEFECPSGYSWQGDECWLWAEEPVIYECDSGWTLKYMASYGAQMCTYGDSTPLWPTPSCPDGYAYYPDGEICKKLSKADPEPYCKDDDYLLVLLSDYTKICEYTDYKDVTYNCPATYELKTYGADEYKCEKLVYEDFWLSCPYEGYDLVNDEYGSKCAYEDTAAPKFECPSGYSWTEGECYKIEMTDADWVCDSGWSLGWVDSYGAEVCSYY